MDCLSTEKLCIISTENHITLQVLFWNYFDWYYVNRLLGRVTTYRNPSWEHNPTTFSISESSVQVMEDFHHQTMSVSPLSEEVARKTKALVYLSLTERQLQNSCGVLMG